ncbi:hypothetical protein [Mesorhizobium sp. CAU 1741]|uniref:J domain-containing protein n=1 Tax=Mesorhizobium sp. CAU 1741 TaxID=3140366 RepID=UPI00325BD215
MGKFILIIAVVVVVVSLFRAVAPYLYAIGLGLGGLVILFGYGASSEWTWQRQEERTNVRRALSVIGSIVWLVTMAIWGYFAFNNLGRTQGEVIAALAISGAGLLAVHGAAGALVRLSNLLFGRFHGHDLGSIHSAQDREWARLRQKKQDEEAQRRAEAYAREWMKAEREQQAQGQSRRNSDEQAKQEQWERQERAQEEPRNKASDTGGTVGTEKLALELFELSHFYTLEQLNKRRLELLKKVHPDLGGSNMMARMVNEAYELLKASA